MTHDQIQELHSRIKDLRQEIETLKTPLSFDSPEPIDSILLLLGYRKKWIASYEAEIKQLEANIHNEIPRLPGM